MHIAVYPGSFDPITNGHLDIIRRAAGLVDKLYIAVLINKQKKCMFTPQERVAFIQKAVTGIENVEVISYDGLLVEFCKKVGAKAIIKGLRVIMDYEAEAQMALINKKIDPDIETVLLVATENYSFISSSVIKELASYGGDISCLVPAHVQKAIIEKGREQL